MASALRRSHWVELPEAPARRTRQTLELMAHLARDGGRDADLVTLARRVALDGAAPHDKVNQARALFHFVKDRCQYIEDPMDVEVLATPRRTLEDGNGDCDELACTLTTLCRCIGIPGRFVAVTWNPFDPEWRHVYAELALRGQWVAADPTVEDAPLGWAPRPAFRHMRVQP